VVPRQAWAALAVATAATFLTVLDVTAVNVAFPSIERDLDASSRSLSWIVSGYSVTLASLFLLAGRVADRVGRRQTFIGGLLVFLLGSFLVGVAPGVELLIAARVVQATGGSFLLISGLSLVLPAFPVARRSSAIGVIGIFGALGGAVGPTVGALLVDLWSWRLIFLINPPIGLIVLALGARFLPDPPGEDPEGRIDAIGVPVGVAGVALFLLGIIQSESWGFSDARVVALLIGGLALIPVAVYRSSHHPRPLLDLDLFKIRSFSVATTSFFLFACGFIPSLLLQSLVLQTLWDMPVSRAGLALTPWPAAAAVFSYPAGRLGDRFGHRWVCTIGALLIAGAHLYLALRLGSDQEYWAVFFPSAVVAGLGSGLTVINFQAAALSDVAPAS
jgi:EmrB/QacA subfamily drug resistance transporter